MKNKEFEVRIRMVSLEEGKRVERLWSDLSAEEQQEITKKFKEMLTGKAGAAPGTEPDNKCC